LKKKKLIELTIYAMVAAIYAVITINLSFLSFGAIQFRIAEALLLLCFYNKRFFIPLVLGCFVSNIFSSLGPIDMLVGSIATVISLIFVMKSKNLIIASIFPVLINGIMIGIELSYVENSFNFETILFNFGTVALGEFVCVCIFGVIMFKLLEKNKGFMELIKPNNQED